MLVRDAYLWLECKLDRILDGFGENTLIIGAHRRRGAWRRGRCASRTLTTLT